MASRTRSLSDSSFFSPVRRRESHFPNQTGRFVQATAAQYIEMAVLSSAIESPPSTPVKLDQLKPRSPQPKVMDSVSPYIEVIPKQSPLEDALTIYQRELEAIDRKYENETKEIELLLKNFQQYTVEWFFKDLPAEKYLFQEHQNGTLVLALAPEKLELQGIEELAGSLQIGASQNIEHLLGPVPEKSHIFILLPLSNSNAYMAITAGYSKISLLQDGASFKLQKGLGWSLDRFTPKNGQVFFDLYRGESLLLSIESKIKI